MMKKIIGKMHFKCRNSTYPRCSVRRCTVPDDRVPWDVEWPEYRPIAYTSPGIRNQPWADPDINAAEFRPLWNAVDGDVDRRSHEGTYRVIHGFPLNPIGRTGMTGRGALGRWGPNHAADPVLTRWKRNEDESKTRDQSTGKPILQFVAVRRKDCGEWAIPGGMVDPGEVVTATLKREFLEEALNVLAADETVRKEKGQMVEEYFTGGVVLYKGYVDDPRNTDSAWMETVATNFHDEDGKYSAGIDLEAGDDASQVKWVDISSSLSLYASHLDFIHKVALIRNSHW